MNIKDWLNRGYHLDEEIRAIQAARDRTSEQACGTTANYMRELDARLSKLLKTEHEIQDVINRVEDATLRTLLIERYINYKTWDQIAACLWYDVRHIYRLHARALKAAASYVPLEEIED